MTETVLIVGAGAGLSASVARRFAREGARVALAARDPGKIKDLAADLDAKTYACDVADRASVDAMVAQVTADLGLPDVVLFNASARLRGPFTALDSRSEESRVGKEWARTCISWWAPFHYKKNKYLLR